MRETSRNTTRGSTRANAPIIKRALTTSPEQFKYIWRETIPHIEVGMGSGLFTSHRSARFVLIGD